MVYIRRHIFTLLTLLLIATLSLMPAQEFPETDIQFADKWAHWVMYGFLTLVMGIECILRDEYLRTKTFAHGKEENSHKNKGTVIGQFLLIFIIASAFGGLMELGQAYLTTTRHGDLLDVLANSFGALCALVLLIIYHLFTGKRS